MLCEEHGVTFDYSSRSIPNLGPDETSDSNDSGGIEIQDAFKKDDSKLEIFGFFERTDPEGQSIYTAACQATVTEDDASLDDANPLDGVAITWSDSKFQPVEQSIDNYGEVGFDIEEQSYKDYKRFGVIASVNDDEWQSTTMNLDGNAETFTCGIETEIEKLEYGNQFNVNGEYVHSWNFGGIYFLSSFDLGPVGINLGGTNVGKWRREDTVKL